MWVFSLLDNRKNCKGFFDDKEMAMTGEKRKFNWEVERDAVSHFKFLLRNI